MEENRPVHSYELQQIGFTCNAIAQFNLNNEVSIKKHGLHPLICSKLDNKKQESKIYELSYIVKIEKLNKLLKELEKEEIQYILLKGIVLANTVYEHEYTRPFSDIDILVYETDRLKVAQILKRLNYYNPSGKDYIVSYAQFTRRLNISKSLNLDIDVHLELVGNLIIRSIISVDELFRNHTQLLIGKNECKVISKPYLLLHSCIHYNQHKIKGDFIRLIWIIDTKNLIDTLNSTEIECFINLVNQKGMMQIVKNTLFDVEKLMTNFDSKVIVNLLKESSKEEISFLKKRTNLEYHLSQLMKSKNGYMAFSLTIEKLIRPRKFLTLKYGNFHKILYIYYYIKSFFD